MVQQVKPDDAFSLVELSIVLVILGLLTGGILAGKNLIRAAEIRAIGTEYQRYITAMHSFRDRYFGLPGDITNATMIWGKDATYCNGQTGTAATPGTCNGNGNNTFSTSSANATSEMYRFWQQLALAGLLEGSYTGVVGPSSVAHSVIGTNIPASKLTNAGWTVYTFPLIAIDGAGWANFEGTYDNQLVFGGASTGITEVAIIKAEEAWNLDTKIDDGKPGLGRVRTFENNSNCHDAGTSTTVALAATANYKLTSTTTAACMLTFNLN